MSTRGRNGTRSLIIDDAMPLFCFSVNETLPDPEFGHVELESLAAARTNAAALLTELLRNAPDRWEDTSVTVADGWGLVLFVMRMAEQATPATLDLRG